MSNLFEKLHIEFEHDEKCIVKLGPHASYAWKHDPKHLFFTLARYKFCSKMLDGYGEILEVGCGEGFGSKLLTQTGSRVHGIDINMLGINYNIAHNYEQNTISFECKNIIESPMSKQYDAAISMDVIEHIPYEYESIFLRNITLSLKENAPCIIGTPNITASVYQSEGSKLEHINLKSHTDLALSLKKYFYNVFIFSMNDEVVHTGFYPMAHYLIALAVGPKK